LYVYDLSEKLLEELQNIRQINLQYLLEFYHRSEDKQNFLQEFFFLLAGSDQLRKQIMAGKTEKEIRTGWQPGLEEFKTIRSICCTMRNRLKTT
jgi:uncharacterized protein YbbC (DUF1343 family)